MLATALGMIEMGTTGVIDVSQVNNTPEHSDALIRALQDAGIRAVFGYSGGYGPGLRYPQDIARLKRIYFSSKDQLVTLALGAGPDPRMFAVAREHDVPLVAHLRNVLPQRNDGERLRSSRVPASCGRATCTSTACICRRTLAADQGVRRPRLAVHRDRDDDGAWHARHPGRARQRRAAESELRPRRDTGVGHVHADADDVHRATLLRHAARARRRPESPPLLTCRDLLEFATFEGARCANIDSKVGTLTPGKEADLLMLRADRIDVWPLNIASGAVVNLMGPSHVETVFIAGKVKKWRGNLVGVDMPRVLRSTQDARDGVLRRAGFQVDLLG